MRAFGALRRAGYLATIRSPLFLVSLLVFAVGILSARFLTMFEFGRETEALREMAFSSMTLWGILLAAVRAGPLITAELEDRTAILVLSKPVRRWQFLVAKAAALLQAQALGLLLLTSVFFYVLWLADGAPALRAYPINHPDPPDVFLWKSFFAKAIPFTLQAGLFCLFQCAILTSACVSFAAFFPPPVTLSAAALLYLLANISVPLIERWRPSGGLAFLLAQALAYSLPNFGFLNLPQHISEGTPVSFRYLFLTGVYTTMYTGIVLWIASSVFQRREMR